ncbi:MAG: sensor histidine kinase [Alphaproteobacteria bacterium]|nr:sensor histidine kinase [Alphaproteobacteria bacterium]
MFQKLLLLTVRDVGWPAKLGFALCGVMLAIILRAITHLVAPGVSPYAFIYPAALLTTLLGGWQSGLLALTVSETLGWLVVVPQAGMAGLPMRYQLSAAVIAALTGLSIIALAHAFRLAARFGFTERGEKLAEREMLFRELQHRVANDFALTTALLKHEARQSLELPIREALDEAAQRINSFARIHRQIYLQSDVISVNLTEYIEDLCGSLRLALPQNVKLTCDLPPLLSQRDIALALGLLMNELVTNALKHAFPDGADGTVLVRIRPSANGWEFSVKDDGAGIGQIIPGLGTGLIDQFARQAGGQLSLDHANGTCVRLMLPANAMRPAVLLRGD